MAESHRRQIRNYLLDRQLQLRYTLIMVLISSLLTAGLGYIWYQQMRVTSRSIEVKMLISMSEQEVQQIKDEMQSHDRLRLLVLVAFGVLFALAVAGYGIVLTHKVAGPLFKISRYMSQVKEGNLAPIHELRKGDQLHTFFGGFKTMHTALRDQCTHELRSLDGAITALEKMKDSSEADDILGQLRKLRDDLAKRLGG